MFTGIVEEQGVVSQNSTTVIVISAKIVLEDAQLGDSISVNGCCLTVAAKGPDWWQADLSQETLDRTYLGELPEGAKVNLERPVRLSDRLGGHLVQGHVDGVGEVLEPAPQLRVKIPSELLKYVVEKGSVTIDGVSLTVVNLYEDGVDVALIPHTMEVTNLGAKEAGDKVNIEVDVMAKYAERLFKFATETNS